MSFERDQREQRHFWCRRFKPGRRYACMHACVCVSAFYVLYVCVRVCAHCPPPVLHCTLTSIQDPASLGTTGTLNSGHPSSVRRSLQLLVEGRLGEHVLQNSCLSFPRASTPLIASIFFGKDLILPRARQGRVVSRPNPHSSLSRTLRRNHRRAHQRADAGTVSTADILDTSQWTLRPRGRCAAQLLRL
jgi:hypothetical protein